MKKIALFLTLIPILLSSCSSSEKIKVLIVDGQNNHTVWPKSTMMIKDYLEETGKFTVDIERTVFTWRGKKWMEKYPIESKKSFQDLKQPKTDPNFSPEFSKYDVIISNFGWKAANWPETTQKALEFYMSNGGGFVSVHAADNSFPEWLEYNKMIGLGGWAGRDESDGPYVYYNQHDELVRDTSPGGAGHHGPQREILIKIRDTDHPITKGMPLEWLHTQDECYDKLRGPAENMTILASAWAGKDQGGFDRHEPMMMVLHYGKGRIFHTTLGHEDYSFEGVGLLTSIIRGTEWAATGTVTIPIPEDFPTKDQATSRAYKK